MGILLVVWFCRFVSIGRGMVAGPYPLAHISALIGTSPVIKNTPPEAEIFYVSDAGNAIFLKETLIL